MDDPISRARTANSVVIPWPRPKLSDLTADQYERLAEIGYLYHFYPEATGDIDADLPKGADD